MKELKDFPYVLNREAEHYLGISSKELAKFINDKEIKVVHGFQNQFLLNREDVEEIKDFLSNEL